MGSIFVRTRTHKDGKKADYWCIEYRVNGKTRRETVGKKEVVTKTIARELLKKRELQIKLGQWDMIDAKIPTLEGFSKKYIEYQRDLKQKRSWKKDVEHLKRWKAVFGSRKLSEISAKDIDDYKLKRLAKVKPTSVNRELEVLRHLFYLAKRWKRFFGENPVSESGLLEANNQMERILTPEEEERLLAASAPHLKSVITTALNTGMRKGEILSLTWEDVDFENKLIMVRATVSKSKKARKIPISSALRKVLLEQKLKTGWREQLCFSDP